MILSERELELGTDHGGIMVLADELVPGTPLADVLPLGDDVLEIETVYNRPDLTSVYGIAREVAALTGVELRRCRAPTRRSARTTSAVDIAIDDLEAARASSPGCSATCDRRVAGVAEGAPDRCRDAVDLERRRRHELRDARPRQPAPRVRLGDARGRRIVVRRAAAGEELVTLDGTRRELDGATS